MRNKVLHAFKGRAPSFRPATILDVGANVGQSTAEFREFFPSCRIIALEPISEAFVELKQKFAGDPLVLPFQVALSRANGELKMVSNGASTGNRIIAVGSDRPNVETVQTMAGDSFCEQNSIERIDFLKIDTEGHEIDVLVGFAETLRLGWVEFVQVECGFAPENTYHVPYHYVADTLFAFGYRLWGVFGLNNKMPRLGTRRGVLYGDAVFIREDL